MLFRSSLPIPDLAQFIIFIIGYLLLSYNVLWTSIKNISRGNVFDENFLMSIATIGAVVIGEYPEAIAVMFLYQLGEYLQDLAVDRSRRNLADAMNLKAKYANLLKDGNITIVKPESIHVGDMILIKPNEKVPLDGVVIEGNSFLDTSSLTGEPVPVRVADGEDIMSGCLNGDGTLTVKVTKPYKDSTIAKILDLVENAAARKSQAESFITKFARVYTPIVVIAALALCLLIH